MAAIDFPNSPSTNDTFTTAGKTWLYNGVSWTLVGVSTANLQGETGATGATTCWVAHGYKPVTTTVSANNTQAQATHTTLTQTNLFHHNRSLHGR